MYGKAMKLPLPYNGFRWENASIFDTQFIKNYKWNENSESRGYILECDIE